jgi:citrate synthase
MSEQTIARGLEGVMASQSSLSFVGGEEGTLIYRGYDIHDLAPAASFVETVFLLWHDRLPSRDELDSFDAELREARGLDPRTLEILRSLPRDTTPMAALRTAVSAEGTLDPDAEDNSAEANLRKAKRLVARFPTIVAAYHRLREGAEPVAPDPELDHSANFLYMISGEVPSRMASEAVDRTLLLYLDHGFNASTFACRVIAATLGDMHSAITGGIGALKGSLHGGANAKAMDMLLEIDEVPRVVPFVEEALEKKQKIMGFGHRVYRTEDPRATHLREMSRTLSQDLGDPKWYEISRLLEDELKGRKGLNPNVDFYCATVYYALGLPTDLYTPLFAMGRIGGWSAHVMEQHADNRLIRPRAEYVGAKDRQFVPIDQR